MQRRTWTFPLASLLFFGSGALGLGYELLWIRKATLIVGSAQIALATVLSAFFVGLALGSEIFGRRFRLAARSPLWLYGVLELGIGLYALALPWLFGAVDGLYGVLYEWTSAAGAALFALRFGLLFVLFLPPTVLMGGTLPLLLDGLVGEDRRVGSSTSFLYGINVLGAVAGVLATGYLAIPRLGVDASSRLGGICNLAIGAMALVAFRRLQPVNPVASPYRPDRFYSVAAFASGLLALAYQIGWARHFSLFRFNSVHQMAMLLAVFLLALACGSLLLAPLLRAGLRPLRLMGTVQALIPALTLLLLRAWTLADHRLEIAREALPDGTSRPTLTFELAHDSPRMWHFFNETMDAIFFAPLFQIALVLFVPVLLIGIGLPALVAAATRHAGGLRGASGRLVFWNTLGSSAGGFAAGYLLLPLFGLDRGWLVLGLGSILLSWAVLRRDGTDAGGPASRWIELAPPLAGTLALVVLTGTLGGATRDTIRRQLTHDRPESDLVITDLVEGPLTTAYITEDSGTIRLTSGSVQMGHVNKGAVNTQAIAGHLPVIFYPGKELPRDALGLCLGSGQSFGAQLRYPLERMDVVEISQEVVNLALDHLAPYNNDLADDPRVRLHVDDARHFVQRAADDSYDLISMESPPPTSDGAYTLYSVEFYEQVRRILRPDGVFMQFMPLYFLTPNDVRAVLATMAIVFPETFVVKVTFGDFALLGYARRPTFDTSAMRGRCRTLAEEWSLRGLPPAMRNPTSRHPIGSFEGAVSSLVMSPRGVARMEAPLILEDSRQLLAYGTGDRWLARRYGGTPLIHISFAALQVEDFARFAGYFDPPLTPALAQRLAEERTASLRELNARDERQIRLKSQALGGTTGPIDRARLAMSLALDYDAVLNKPEAYRHVAIAAEALGNSGGTVEPALQEALRKIVRNRIAVYHDIGWRQLEVMESRFGASPLLEVMREELTAYRERTAAVDSRYLFSRSPP